MTQNYYHNQSYFGVGTTQNSRFLKALRPSYIRLDDRELPELLAFSKEYARLINYYNHENRPEGDWEEFFDHDISVILATLISTDLEKIEAQHNEILAGFRREHETREKLEYFIQLLEQNYDLASRFDTWYRQIREINFLELKFETIIETELYGILFEKVKENVQRLKAINDGGADKTAFDRAFELEFDQFDDFWDLDTVEPENVYKGDTEAEKLHSGLLQLRLLYRNLHQSLSYSVFHFQKYFLKSLSDKSNHHPNIGLFISFLKLFKHHQTEFNNVTDRYLHYYYGKYLRQNANTSNPDKVHVLMDLANHVKRFELEKGTLLDAGKDKNRENVHYRILQDSVITQAEVESLKTVFVSRRDDLESTNYSLVTDIFSAPIANSSDGKGRVFEENEDGEWALFGEEQEYKPLGYETMQNASIGFAIASPIFFLKEGHRKIKLKFNFDPSSTKVFKKLILDIQKKVNDLNPVDATDKTLEEVFYENVFNKADETRSFRIFMTGSRSWLEADPNYISINASGAGNWKIEKDTEIEDTLSVLNALTIEFEVPTSKPSIVAYDAEVIKNEDFQTSYPVVKILINKEKQPYAYSLLKKLKIANVEIEVEVEGMKKFDLFSDFGAIDNRQPFAPFGAQPTVGSSLLIGNPEIFRKKLNKFSVDIEWKDIPETVSRFQDYYRAYHMEEFSPPNYKVKVSALSGNRFKPVRGDDSTLVPLFNTNNDNTPTKGFTSIIDTKLAVNEEYFDRLDIEPDPQLEEENAYDNETKTGYFKLELREPQHAFGHQVYQEVFTNVVTKNAKSSQGESDEIPKQPYTPYIKTLRCNYTANAKIQERQGSGGNKEKIFHIHPFGIQNIYENGTFRSKKNHMMPQYDGDGYLYIGLVKANPPEPISFLFQLTARKSRVSTRQFLPEVTWSYLSRNEWRDFRAQDMLFDSTDNFTKSGIIRLQLPRNISNRSTVMESGMCWLRVRVDGDTEVLSHALAVRAQAVTAEWVVNSNNKDKIRKPLPPYTITNLVERRGEIKDVVQPFESFIGRPAENNEEYFSRVSERLRHKNRAVTHWDFERIILNKFQAIYQVKCLSSLSNPIPKGAEEKPQQKNLNEEVEVIPQGIAHKEGLVLVVIPKTAKYIKDSTPKLNYKDLQTIENYLKEYTSPFVKLKVRNPQYEYVRVLANVKFISGHNNGLSLKRLNTDIARFIAPWLETAGIKINIGGSINENVLKNYIKGLPYVKFITKFSLLHILEENGRFKLEDTAEDENQVSIIKARPWGVLLPDEDHEIQMVSREEEMLPIKRIDSDSIIRFQNRINLTGHKKYIKIKNPDYIVREKNVKNEEDRDTYLLSIKV